MLTHFVEKFSEGDTDRQLEAMREAGFKFVPLDEAEILYCASIVKMNEALSAKRKRSIPLAVYCWDYYLWCHGQKNTSGDWVRYADFLRQADIIFVPSKAQQLRLKELLDLDSHVVHTGIPTYEGEAKTGDYILDPVRYYPEENRTWAEDAAKELGIPLIHSEHQYNKEEFEELVRNCRFLVCALREASTGGLTLMEGLWHGKPSLVSDSPYQGAADYVAKSATYFQYDDFEDLKKKMSEMWNETPIADKTLAREYISQWFSYQQMAERLYALCRSILKH